jgi:hypothetical protein
MTLNKVITISLYNRVDYSKQVLEHLSKCIGVEDYEILVHIDRSPWVDELMDLVGGYSSDLDIHVFSPAKNLGCNRSIYECLDWGFEDTDYLIHIEDDILLSYDALKYFEWAGETFKNDQTVFTVDGYNNENPFPVATCWSDNLHIVKKATSFKPWGWAIWKDRWEGIKDRWQFNYGSRYEQGKLVFGGGGWDVCMKQYLRGDRCRVYPLLARTKNIGAKNGTHTPSEEWHHRKHHVDVWANDISGLGSGYNLVVD